MTRTQHRQFPITAAEESAAVPVCVGRFGYRPGAETMWWSRRSAPRTATAAEAGDGQMSVQVLLEQLHPHDRAPLAEALAGGRRFCLRVRLPERAGGERTLILIADRPTAEGEPGAGVEGYYIDLTDLLSTQHKALLDEKLPSVVAAGAAVEQATGMLRLVYGLSVDKAHEILLWRAEETGMPVTEFAARLCAAVAGEGRMASAPLRTRVDDLLLTLHERGTAD